MVVADMNVEHAQLLLFLFNFLTFMQKKAALLITAKGIVRVGEMSTPLTEEAQFFFVSRLLLFFDHIMKHLYDPPSFLLEQVSFVFVKGKEKYRVFWCFIIELHLGTMELTGWWITWNASVENDESR